MSTIVIDRTTEKTLSPVIEIKSLVGAKLLVRQCYVAGGTDDNGEELIRLPDRKRDKTSWSEILMVGDDRNGLRIGDFVVAHEHSTHRVGPFEFIVSEDEIEPYVYREEA